MKTLSQIQGLLRRGSGLMLGAALLIGSLVAGGSPAWAAQSRTPAADVLPVSTCALTAGTLNCDLWAMKGTVTMPGSALPISIWGYAATSAGPAALPGPTLIITQGVPVNITLHNIDLPTATSLSLSGQPMIPDTTGVTGGNSKTYSFSSGLNTGTYLYEAGLTADGPRQVAMGLYGALIVRPASCGVAPQCAYTAASAYDDEALLVLSEIDPAFNAAPSTFDMSAFAPKYWLINGKAYPNTDSINSDVNHQVLLRYVNAGLRHHSMSLSGLHQTIYAANASPVTHPLRVIAQTIPTGSTLDTIVKMPASAPENAKYALFEAAMHTDNAGKASGGVIDFGGMLTFLTTAAATPTSSGPVVSNVSLTPNPTSGPAGTATGPVTLTATINAFTGANLIAAEYFVDTLGADGAGCPISGATGSSAIVSVQILVSGAAAHCADLTTLLSASHTFYVHGKDSSGTGTWGAFASAVLNLDKAGPTVSNASPTPARSNGTVDIALQATGSDVATGNQSVTAAEYTIDGGTATAMTIGAPATTVSLNAIIPASTVAALADGSHTVAVRTQDALGNWGAFGTITLIVDKTAPGVSGATVQPTPNNGTLGVQIGTGGTLYLRIDATVADPAVGGVNSNIVAAEYFIDTVGANGTGGAMIPSGGAFNSPSGAIYGAVDLFVLNQLATGSHTIYVHGKDAAGNWGTMATTVLTIDKVPPTVSGVTLTPAAVNNQAVAISAAATDVATGNSNIAGGEFFIDTVTAPGTGTTLNAAVASPATTIAGNISGATIAALTAGNHTVYVRAKDAAGNWSVISSAVLLIDRTAPTFSSINITPASINAGTASVLLTVNGATDGAGGSGVTGGEYWFGATNIPAGTGTAFNGLSNINIATAALTPGSYTLRVRIHDAVGNWSTGTNGVRTTTLTVTSPPLAPPTVSKLFSGAVSKGGNTTARTTTLVVTLSNSNAVAITGVSLTDNLPQPTTGTLTIVGTPATTCGGLPTSQNGNRRVRLTGGTIPANGSCTVTATVRISAGATNGPTLTNTISTGGVASTNAGSNTGAATATLTVNP